MEWLVEDAEQKPGQISWLLSSSASSPPTDSERVLVSPSQVGGGGGWGGRVVHSFCIYTATLSVFTSWGLIFKVWLALIWTPPCYLASLLVGAAGGGWSVFLGDTLKTKAEKGHTWLIQKHGCCWCRLGMESGSNGGMGLGGYCPCSAIGVWGCGSLGLCCGPC